MTAFIESPSLALVPALAFVACYWLTRRKLAGATAALWAGYALYEYAVQRRWLCSGECNIRVDLLLLYPLLSVLSLAAAVAVAATIIRTQGSQGGAAKL